MTSGAPSFAPRAGGHVTADNTCVLRRSAVAMSLIGLAPTVLVQTEPNIDGRHTSPKELERDVMARIRRVTEDEAFWLQYCRHALISAAGGDGCEAAARAVLEQDGGTAARATLARPALLERLTRAVQDEVADLRRAMEPEFAPGGRVALFDIAEVKPDGARILTQRHKPPLCRVVPGDDSAWALAWDVMAAEWVARRFAREEAAELIQRASERYEDWRAQPDLWTDANEPAQVVLWRWWLQKDGIPRFLRRVAALTWKRDRSGYLPKLPAIRQPLASTLQGVYLNPRLAPNYDEDGQLVLLDRSGGIVARVVDVPGNVLDLDMLSRIRRETRAPLARFVRYIADELGQPDRIEARARREPDADVLVFEGGETDLAKRIRARSPEVARLVLRHGRAVETEDFGGLWTNGRHGSTLRVKLAEVWFLRDRESFCPLPSLAFDAPAVGGPQNIGSMEAFFLFLWPALRRQAHDAAAHNGGWSLPSSWWKKQADAVGVPTDLVEPLRHAYLTGTDNTPAVFAMHNDGRYALSKQYTELETKLLAGGRKTARAIRGGKVRASRSQRAADGRFKA